MLRLTPQGRSMSFNRIHILFAAAAAAAAGAAAVPALTTGQGSAGRDIVVREKVLNLVFVRQSPDTNGDRMAMGDRVLTRQALFDTDDKRVGTLVTDCTK